MGIVVTREQLVQTRGRLKADRKRVVFTNGCFDILHRGHIDYLAQSKALGDVLVVGVNSDDSVRRLKGPGRPIVSQDDRAAVVAALGAVDFVTVFSEDTPLELIQAVVPDVLVKGSDWSPDKVVGKDVVEQNGGNVRTVDFVSNRSTTSIIERIRSLAGRSAS